MSWRKVFEAYLCVHAFAISAEGYADAMHRHKGPASAPAPVRADSLAQKHTLTPLTARSDSVSTKLVVTPVPDRISRTPGPTLAPGSPIADRITVVPFPIPGDTSRAAIARSKLLNVPREGMFASEPPRSGAVIVPVNSGQRSFTLPPRSKH